MKNFKNIVLTLSMLLSAQATFSMQKPAADKPAWLKSNDDMVHAVRTGDVAFIKNSKVPADRVRMIRDGNNNNLLHMAVESNQLPVVKLLVEEYQVNQTNKNTQKKTALDVAKAKGFNNIIAYLTTKESAAPATKEPKVQPTRGTKPAKPAAAAAMGAKPAATATPEAPKAQAKPAAQPAAQPAPQAPVPPKRSASLPKTVHEKVSGLKNPTAYEILGVPATATQAEIRAAYKAKTKEWYPDKNADVDANEAYDEVKTK